MMHNKHLIKWGKYLIISLLCILSCYTIAQEQTIPLAGINHLSVDRFFHQGEPVSLRLESFSLSVDSGCLVHDLSLQLTLLKDNKPERMPSNMVNTTGDLAEAYRLLPNGEHFQMPAKITIPYDPDEIPMGYNADKVYSFYFDEENGQWTRLERISVDTIAHTVTSYTTHFTDFANAVIKVPDMPESQAFVPTAMADIPEINPMQGIPMIAAPQANNRGTAELTYPIELPQGRNGLQPNVDLHYSSAGGNGILGVGWSLSMPSITIDTRWGVPRYDPQYETEQYTVNGDPIVLRNADGAAFALPYQENSYLSRLRGAVRFYARDTKNQNRIIRYGSTPKDYWWTVTDVNGITTFYGRPLEKNGMMMPIDKNSVVRTDAGDIVYWAATATVDVFGNYILYKNENVENSIYVNEIAYTGNLYHEISPTYFIHLAYKDREDISSNGRLGVLQVENQLLCHVLVQYLDPQKIYPDSADNLAAYFMYYTQPKEETLFKSRLEKVVMLDSVHDFMLNNRCVIDDRLNLPASTTSFSYEDAPKASEIFQEAQNIANSSDCRVSSNQSQSWSVGGTVTVGYGPDVATTIISGGGNYDYSRSKGGSTTMLLDLDGDGLTDIVYEDENKVYYKRQRLNNNGLASFDSPQLVSGLTRLAREISNTHTWGVQMSFGANLSYSRPITTSYTDTYFSDVNADGLPDMIDGDNILINHLVDSIPMFDKYSNVESLTIPVNNSCGTITMDGEVDRHIECELVEVWRESLPLDIMEDGEYLVGYEAVTDTNSCLEGSMNENYLFAKETSIINPSLDKIRPEEKSHAYKDDGLFYRIENDQLNGYTLEYVCKPEKVNPDIEMVRVWVAPREGPITLYDTIYLLQDESESRVRSITADGVESTIQYCREVSSLNNDTRLKATDSFLWNSQVIDANDYKPYNYKKSISVKKGDIILFRLRSRGNNLYDKTYWHHIIKYTDTQAVYDSERDYICTGDDYFLAVQSGDIVLSFKGRNDDNTPVALSVRKISTDSTCVSLLDTVLNQGTFNLPILYSGVQTNDAVKIVMFPVVGMTEPLWSKVHLFPTLQYISDFKTSDSSNLIVHDTVTYYPGVQIKYSSVDSTSSPYRKLFGPLHRGWGEFAYQNIENGQLIDLSSLVNTQLVAADYVNNNKGSLSAEHNISISPNDSNCLTQVDSICASYNVYDPIAENNYWIPMRADSRTELWISYGNLGCIGKTVHSNALEITIENQMEDIIEYDSSLPYAWGSANINKFVRKQSRSVQNSISWGAMGIINESASFGSFETVVDYMDLNGDGYPDIIGKGGVQYSTPWGGIGKLMIVDNFTPFRSANGAVGVSFSGSRTLVRKLMGNSPRDGKFYMDASVGISTGTGWSETCISYADVNADGLPDKVDVRNKKVRYNLGYSFTKEYDYNGFANVGRNVSGSASAGAGVGIDGLNSSSSSAFSMGQVSISGGGSVSSSTDHTSQILMDINGDGLPDLVECRDDGTCIVAYNMGQNDSLDVIFKSPQRLSSISNLNNNLTLTHSISASATGGFTLFGIIKFGLGIQVSPYSKSISHGEVVMIDMNGDGQTDYVTKNGDTLYVRYNTSGHANLLQKVTNPTGQEIHLQYRLSEPTQEHRGRHWNMVRVVNIDSNHPMQGAAQNIMTYEYHDAFYDNYERTDYGYSHVKSISNNEKIKNEYYYNRSMLQKGELWKDILSDDGGNIYISHVHESRFVDILSGEVYKNGEYTCDDANARMSNEHYWTEYYEKDTVPQIITAYDVTYDRYHNIVSYDDAGDISIHDDDWRKTIKYLSNEANNMVSLPIEESIFGASGQTMRSSYVNYNQMGKPAHIGMRVSANDDAITSLSYDKYGNICSMTFPIDANGERNWLKFDYDSLLHSYVSRIINPFSNMTVIEYDPRWGTPIRETDPAGNEINYEYDYKGRVEKIIAPYESANGLDYTVKYTYNLIRHNLIDSALFQYTHVCKDLQDRGVIQHEVSFYDALGRLMQKKHYAEVNGRDEWVVDGAYDWDAYGRVTAYEFPFIAESSFDKYEPIGQQQAVVLSSYDVMDRPLKRLNADGSSYINHYHFSKDVNSVMRLMTQATDENGINTQILRSPQNWVVQQVAGDSSTTFFEYSPIGELLRSTDPGGYQTKYTYDMLGRTIWRQHPDAGETKMEYDLAGNLIRKQTANLALTDEWINYDYKFSRLLGIRYPQHPENNVGYTYDPAGRVSMREDGTGSEMFEYDPLGNISKSIRRVVIPTEDQAYIFQTQYDYDSFGKMRSIVYPDGEIVTYDYTTGGILKSVCGKKKGTQHVYLQDRLYDEQGRILYTLFGNGVETSYKYDPSRQWLQELHTENTRLGVLQNILYHFDDVGNITHIDQTSSSFINSNIGGYYQNDYQYDRQYRLVSSMGNGNFPYHFNASYSPSGRMGNKVTATTHWATDLIYGYDKTRTNHQIRTTFDPQIGTLDYYWDANGNLAQIIGCEQNAARLHEWDEENRLRFVLGPNAVGYYGYDGNGERVYKLMGKCSMDQVNSGYTKATAIFDDCVLYPNPYLVVTAEGYTKHYYAGSERLATVLGSGGFFNIIPSFDELNVKHDKNVLNYFHFNYSIQDPFRHEKVIGAPIETIDINGNQSSELNYQCKPAALEYLELLTRSNILQDAIAKNKYVNHSEQDRYYYHGDHLGSASWITDNGGNPIQYLHYAPYGELIANQKCNNYDERYKFTGKERDWESGYDFFGARFFWSVYGHWLSVDPWADKYPWVSPYAYCAWNPIKFVDPDGKEIINKIDPLAEIPNQQALFDAVNNFRDKSDHIFFAAHGNSDGMYPCDAGIEGLGSTDFVSFLNSESELWKTTEDKSTIVIVLLSCETGKGENSLAQKISKNLPENYIVAPSEEVKSAGEGVGARILGTYVGAAKTMQDAQKKENHGVWRVFKNGEEVAKSASPKISYVYQTEF